MGKFIDKTAREIISELNVSYFLPDIQRDYVWLNNPREKKIEQLFDSILRGYPIGTFLFWKLKKNDIETDKNKDSKNKLNFQLYKFIENYDVRHLYNEKINIEKEKAEGKIEEKVEKAKNVETDVKPKKSTKKSAKK